MQPFSLAFNENCHVDANNHCPDSNGINIVENNMQKKSLHTYYRRKRHWKRRFEQKGNNAILAHELERVITQLKELQEEVKRMLYTLLEFAIIIVI